MTAVPDHRTFFGSHAAVRISSAAVGGLFLLLLARSVPPGPFAMIAIGSAFLAAGQIIVELGTETALIQAGVTAARQSAALLAGFISSALLWGALHLSAAWWDRMFHVDGVGGFMVALVGLLPLSVVQSPFRAALLESRSFPRIAIIEAIATGTAFLAGVAALAVQPSAYAFFWFILAGNVARCILFWRSSPVRPRLADLWAPDLSILRMGRHILASSSLTFLGKNLDDVILGLRAGPLAVSLYSLSYRAVTAQQDFLSGPLNRLALPAYSAVKTDLQEVYRLFCRDTLLIVSIAAPLFTFVALESPTLIAVLLGPSWLAAAPLLSILCVEALRQSLLSMAGTAIVATGGAKQIAKFSLISTLLLVATFLLGAGQHIEVFAWCFVAVNTILNVHFLRIVLRHFRQRAGTVAFQWIPGMVVAAWMVLCAFVLPAVHGWLSLIQGGLVALILSWVFYTRVFPRAGAAIRALLVPGGGRDPAHGNIAGPMTVWTDVGGVGTNPHLGSLHEEITRREGILFKPAHLRTMILGPTRRDGIHILHLHFPHTLYSSRRAAGSLWKGCWVAVKISALRFRGFRFVLTVHNRRAHDFPHRRVERLVQYLLYAQCDLAITFSRSAEKELLEECGYPERLMYTAHPTYATVYPPRVPLEVARRALGIAPDERVFLFFGPRSPYKDFETLLEAFACMDGADRSCLLVAGGDDTKRDMPEVALPPHRRLLAHHGFVDTEKVPLYFSAADAGVLPYREVLHSGTLLLFCTFEVPVIVPELGCFPEMMRRYMLGALYPPGDVSALARAMSAALRWEPGAFHEGMARLAEDASLANAAEATAAAYRTLASRNRRMTVA